MGMCRKSRRKCFAQFVCPGVNNSQIDHVFPSSGPIMTCGLIMLALKSGGLLCAEILFNENDNRNYQAV